MKLWQKNFSVQEKVERFTTGRDRETDLLIARFDILGSIAHTAMLKEIGLLSHDEFDRLHTEMKQIYQLVEEGNFSIAPGVEDVHSQVELMLTEKLGEVGKKIHSGRSRNDQVLTDIKLFLRHELQQLSTRTVALFDLLQNLSEQFKDHLLPGYTHLQIAMPSSFGLWFGAYAESLADDLLLVQAAYKIANQNPLGSAAGYGSSFPLQRQLTTQLLGFEDMNYNVVYAQMTRGKAEKAATVGIAALAATLAKLAMDACIYLCQNMDFISFPKELTTGSSIMPHKKNPDVFELIRAKCNRLQGLPNDIALIMSNLPSGYHRDMQLIKEHVLPAFEEINDCLEMISYMLSNIEVKENILADDKYKYLFSVEVVNQQVLEGVSFRDAYRNVGMAIEEGHFEPSRKLEHSHEGSIGNLCNANIKAKMQRVIEGFDFKRAERMYELLR